MTDKPVYSTATGSAKGAGKGQGAAKSNDYKPSGGPLKMRLETKGRGGKAVTVLFNLPFPTEAEAVQSMKDLQASLGCGATFKNWAIELRGDMRDRAEQYFTKKGLKVVKAGG